MHPTISQIKMIGRITNKGDSDSSDPHVSVEANNSSTGIYQVISGNARKNRNSPTTHLEEFKSLSQPALASETTHESSSHEQIGCTLAVNLTHVNANDAISSQSSETSTKPVSSVYSGYSASQTIGVMSFKTFDKLNIGETEVLSKTLHGNSISCQEQANDNLHEINASDIVTKSVDCVDLPAGILTSSVSSKLCDVNPMIVTPIDIDSVDINERKHNPSNILHITEPDCTAPRHDEESHSHDLSGATPTKDGLGESSVTDSLQAFTLDLYNRQTETTCYSPPHDPVDATKVISGACDDSDSDKTTKSNRTLVKVSSPKATVSSYAKNISNPLLNAQHGSNQTKTIENCAITNTVLNLNTSPSFHKLKSNSHVYKVQNVLLRTTPNANGFVAKVVPSINSTSSQSCKAPSSNVINSASRSSTTVSKPALNIINSVSPITPQTSQNKDIFKTKRHKKMPQMSFSAQMSSKRRDTTIDHLDSIKKTGGYSTKLPNIISKIRDNLSGNSIIKTKPSRKIFMNTAERLADQMSVVRKYEPKYGSNNLMYNQHCKLKQSRSTDQINLLNRRPISVSVSDKNYEIDNYFTEAVMADASNHEMASRNNSKTGIKTGQNNNIDILPSSPSLWKQVTTSNIGTTIMSENVTPITTSNTWDEVPRFNNKSDQEEAVTNEASAVTQPSPRPQLLIVRGDPQAVSQRTGCDEEFIGEEIRPEPTDHLPAAYHSLQIVLQDHNYGAPPPSTPMMSPTAENFPNNGNAIELITNFNNKALRQHEEEDVASIVSIESNLQANNDEDEETETAPEEENDSPDMMDDKNSITRCICDFQHDDGYMIQCGQCLVWQHIVCVGVTPKRIPKKYLCDFCQPRELDRYRAHALQKMIRDDLNMLTSSDSSPTRSGDKDRAFLKNIMTKKRGESSIHFPLSYNTTRNKRIRRDPSPKVKVRRQYKERKKVLRRKMKTDMDRPSVRPWLENYELAATNHYSQELRARLSGITKKQDERPNFVLTDCTTIPFAGGRIMISTIDILPSTPIIELMGKFMLSSQHQNATALLLGTNSRQVTQKPGPFVFFYRMPQEGTDVCIDTRTYGNEARFVRRSCKPNCELHHWFDKGTLHIYLMSIDKIESNTEITLRHEFGWHGLGIGRTPSNPCACNSPECLLLNPVQSRRTYPNESLPSKPTLRLGKTRGMASRSYLKTKSVSPKSDITIPDDELDEEISLATKHNEVEAQSELISTPVKSSQDSDNTSDDLRKIMAYCSDNRTTAESPKPSTAVSEDALPKASFSKRGVPPPNRRTRIYTRRNRVNKKQHTLQITTLQDPKPIPDSGDEGYINMKDIKKMTREERKIAQVMKVFDRLEKDKAKKTSGVPRGRRQDSESDYARRDESTDMEHTSPNVRIHKSRGKGRRKSQFTRDYKLKSKRTISEGGSEDQPSIKKQFSRKPNSVDGRRKFASHPDVDPNSGTSGASSSNKMHNTEAVTGKRGLRKRKIIFPKKQIAVVEPPQGQQTEEAAGLLLALARSTPATTPCEPGPSNEVAESPIPNMISVCQLVEAAVGPLETSLKSPKKAILNEWMNKPPESPLAFEIAETAPTQAVYAESCSSSSNSPLSLFCLGNESVRNRNIPSCKLLDTLVQAASSICDISTTYPQGDGILQKDTPQDNATPIESDPYVPVVHTESSSGPKNTDQMFDNKLNISHVPENTFNKPTENELFKDELRNVVHITSTNSISDDKSCLQSNDILNKETSDLNFVNGPSNSLGPVECREAEEPILQQNVTQADAYESNITNSFSDNTESCIKTSVLDMTTDLSNDSNNVGSSYQANSSGSAKKRWLHQALSEESDMPLTIEVSTPLKKRRLIRESTSERVQAVSDEINELSIETKNFQSATTVAINSDAIEIKSLKIKNTVVAENTEECLEASPQNENFNQDNAIVNGSPNKENAFDWENLEHHDEIKAKSGSSTVPNSPHNECAVTNSCLKSDKMILQNESPQKNHISDEIADIHKRLQSFHSENIQVLRSRNQKPKVFANEGQRKKVNLMFEVSILEDETVAVELCNEAKTVEIGSEIVYNSKEMPEPVNNTQIVSFDFDEFTRQKSDITHADHESPSHESSVNSVPTSVNSATESTHIDLEPHNPDDITLVNMKMNCLERPSTLLFKDVPSKPESNLPIPACSPNNLNKHEIGIAARARLDSILNATDISQDAMFDQMLKKPVAQHISNHVINAVRNESPISSPIPIVQTGHSKPIARTSSSDPRLQQAPPIKKKLSLSEYRARKKTDGNGNGADVFSSTEKSYGHLSLIVSDAEEEQNDQENFMFTPEPTLVERELEKHPTSFLLRDFFTVPSTIINDVEIESETEESSSDPC